MSEHGPHGNEGYCRCGAYLCPEVEWPGRAALSSGVVSPEPGLTRETLAAALHEANVHTTLRMPGYDAKHSWDHEQAADAILAALPRGVVSHTKAELREALSGAVIRAGLYEVADAMATAIQDGTFADASEEQVRHAVYELVAKSAIEPDEPRGVASQPELDVGRLAQALNAANIQAREHQIGRDLTPLAERIAAAYGRLR